MSGFIRNQGQLLLGNKWIAYAQATLLALLPYTTWLSVAIIALITLRKGSRAGSWLLWPVMTIHFALSLASVPFGVGLINSILTYVPCFLAACVLRSTESWRTVFALFFFQVVVVVILLQSFMPDFITAQFLYFQAVLREVQNNNALLAYLNDNTGLSQIALGSYLLGLQAVGVIFSASVSLILARSVQSQLFYPGGFRQEMLAFRGDKIGLLLLVIMLIAAYQQNILAMSLLPTLVFIFMLAGISLSFNILAKKRPFSSILFLLLTLFLLPFVMLPVYVLFGSLDSLFNFRLYLSSKTGKTI